MIEIEGKVYNEQTPECPYCRIVLKRFPLKKTKCKSCSKDFYTMKKPGTNIHYIVDEKRKSKWNAELPFYGRLDALVEYDGLGMEYVRSALSSFSLKDAVWSCYNKALEINADNPRSKANIYYMMAEFMVDEGRDPILLVKERNNCLLDEIEYRESVLKQFVTIIARDQRCNNCKHLDGIVMEIEDARSLQLLPVLPCNYHFCTAVYHNKSQRDLHGNLIRNENQ